MKKSRFPVRPSTLFVFAFMVVAFVLWGEDILRYFVTGHS